MRKYLTFAASMMLALSMLTAPDMVAQTRSSGSGSTRSSGTTRSGSSSSSTRSSGSSSSVRSSSGGGSSAVRSSSSSSSSQLRSSSSSSQVRSSSSSSSSQVRSSSSYGSSSVRSSSSAGSSAVRSSSSSGSQVRSSSSSSSSQVRSSSATSSAVRGGSSSATGGNVRSTNASRSGLSANAANDAPAKDNFRDEGNNYRYNDYMRMDEHHNMHRVAPRHREPMPWDRPGYFWGNHPHYYGYRVHSLPPHYRRISHWGIDYYYYNGIYYRSHAGLWVVCRPPFGTPLEAAIDRAILRSIRFAYYCDTYRTYSRVFDNYNVIARQNLIIAQNNARIAAQNANYALNANRALTAYELANKLGLVQSYAFANSEYFYQDGVFYSISASGQYTTIVPPAGALVTSLPDDYETIVLNGIEYYMVDNTVYRTTLFDGQPYLEVLGQMYGSLYSQYDIYR